MIDLRLGRWQEVLSNVPDNSARLILTSPPYGNARTYEDSNPIVDFNELADFSIRVLQPGGVLFMVVDGPVNKGIQSTLPFEIACSWSCKPQWRMLQVLIYGRRGSPGSYVGRFRKDHEYILTFVKHGARHVCNKDDIAGTPKKDLNRDVGRSTARKREGSKDVFGLSPSGKPRIIRNVAHRGSIWQYGFVGHGQDKSSSTGHPATFAERFATDAVKVWSNPGDTVIDPFSGSGTVAVAAKALGRSFVGAECIEKYFEIAKARIQQVDLSEPLSVHAGSHNQPGSNP